MLIYSLHNTNRLQYIVEVLWGNAVEFTSDKTLFYHHEGVKINYSTEPIHPTEIRIEPQGLLFEEGIKKQAITTFEWNGLVAFFKSGGTIPFDVFAAAFYLITRYEEYLPHAKDSYGRFAHTESLAYKHQFLYQPLVDLWMQHFHVLIQSVYPNYTIPKHQFSYVPTYDIDIAYAYKGKGVWRQIAAIGMDVVKQRFNTIKERFAVLRGITKDPFDVYDWLTEYHQRYQLQPIYFFLLAKARAKYDKNIAPNNKLVKKLIQSIQQQYKIGIHPSWQSHNDETMLQWEKLKLAAIAQQTISTSRQHYIQFTLPYTFRCLLAAGITNDYSMGYGSINGFRASYTNSFYWYDVMKEEQTALLLHPFCYMEANSFFEQGYTADQARAELQHYHDIVKSVDGQLITIFHNHFITEQPQWLAWRNMYADFLKANF